MRYTYDTAADVVDCVEGKHFYSPYTLEWVPYSTDLKNLNRLATNPQIPDTLLLLMGIPLLCQ